MRSARHDRWSPPRRTRRRQPQVTTSNGRYTRKVQEGGGFMNTIKLYFDFAKKCDGTEEVDHWTFPMRDTNAEKSRWKFKWKNKMICYLRNAPNDTKSHNCIVFHSKNKQKVTTTQGKSTAYYATDRYHDYFLMYRVTTHKLKQVFRSLYARPHSLLQD